MKVKAERRRGGGRCDREEGGVKGKGEKKWRVKTSVEVRSAKG